MIVALLILIVFILLFGAGVVKGFLANAAAIGGGAIILLGLLLWVGSFFGENGFMYVIFAVMGLLLVLVIGIEATKPIVDKPLPPRELPKPPIQFHSNAPSKAERKRLSKALRDMSEHPPF